MIVVVVESPAKAKTINKYLGSQYEVLASFGHVRDLPAKDGSVDPEADFRMIWELEGRGAKQVSEIARAAKGATKLILATDPDREGEAISWHVLEALNQKKALKGVAVERVTFNAITKQAVQEAMRAPREIDQALVDAIQPGIDNRTSVERTLGRPTFISQFGSKDWYYVSQTVKTPPFRRPRTDDQTVYRVRFDGANNVAAIDKRGMEQVARLSPEGDKTPTLGRERGFFQELFGNIGAVRAPVPGQGQ